LSKSREISGAPKINRSLPPQKKYKKRQKKEVRVHSFGGTTRKREKKEMKGTNDVESYEGNAVLLPIIPPPPLTAN
jgi:hypothetical protein